MTRILTIQQFSNIVILFVCSSCGYGNIPDHFYKLPLVGGNYRGGRDVRTASTLLEPVEARVQAAAIEGDMCEGACISSRACEYYGGRGRGACINGNVCCKFERSCDGVSREKIAFFTSPDYPNFSNDSMQCSHMIYPNADVCSIRVDFLELNISKAMKFSGGFYKCIQDNIFVLNTLNGPHEALCEYQNYSALTPTHSLPHRCTQESEASYLVVCDAKQYVPVENQGHATKLQKATAMEKWLRSSFCLDEPNCGRQLLFESGAESTGGNDGLLIEHGGKDGDKDFIVPYVVNGQNAENREFPWQASIQANSKHRCGASIINENYLLTAAHCFSGRVYERPENLRVVVGDLTLESDGDGGSPQILSVESVLLNYNYKSFQAHLNDIAVIKVTPKMKFTSAVQPICLPSLGFRTDGMTSLVSGWGRLNATYSPSGANKLQKLTLRIIPNQECKEMHLKEIARAGKLNVSEVARTLPSSRLMGNDNTHVCALADTNSTVCFGDSGGPLVVQNEEDGRYTQVGIVSFGLGACDVTKTSPVAFSRVSEFLQFVSLATSEM